MDTVYSLEVWIPDGERWRWSAIGAYPTLDMAVAVGEVLRGRFFSVFDFSIHSLSTVAVALAFCGRRGLLHRLRRLLGVFRLFLEGDGGLDGLLVAALLPVQLVGRF